MLFGEAVRGPENAIKLIHKNTVKNEGILKIL